MSRRVVTSWGATAFVAATAVVLVASSWSRLVESPAGQVPMVLVGVGFAATSALLVHQDHQRGNAGLFALMSLVWICNQLTHRPVGAFTAPLFLISNQADVVAAAALLRYPSERLERPAKVFVVAAAATMGLFQLLTLAVATPTQLDLPSAPWPYLLQGRGWAPGVLEAREIWFAICALAFLGFLLRRWLRMAPLERRTLTPIVLTAAFVGLATTPLVLNSVLPPDQVQLVYRTRAYGAVAVAAAFVVSAVQLGLARTALVRFVNRLEVPASAENVQSALREILMDPQVEVLFALPDGGWVDEQGRAREPSDAGAGRMPVLTTTATGAPLAAIVVDDRLHRYRTLLDAAVNVSRFALENARLDAGLRAQLLAVREARARLLSTGLEQRRQLERDLHDGAQQRLLALGLRLGALQSGINDDPQTADAIGLVRKELNLALDELRDLARGIYPAVLTQAGLGPALEAVVERLPLDVEIRVPAQRWDPDVESAAYLVACEALNNAVHHAGDCSVHIDAEQGPSGLRIRVADDGRGADHLDGSTTLRSLNDRVTALGGELSVTSRPGQGTIVEAVLPCG